MTEQTRQPAVGHEPLECVEQEEGVEFGIARAETLGLGGEAVNPCEADGLHPLGRIAFATGIDVESKTYVEQPALAHFVFGPRAEFLLLGGSQSDPDDIGTTGVDLLKDARPFFLREVAVMGSADVELWIEPCRFFDEVSETVLGRTEEVVPDMGRGIPEAAIHELRTVNAVGHDGFAGSQVHAPSERHAVGNEMVDGFRAAAEFRIGEAQHRDVGVGEVDDGRLVRCTAVENLGQILVARRHEQGLAEKDGFSKAVAHGIRRSEKREGWKAESGSEPRRQREAGGWRSALQETMADRNLESGLNRDKQKLFAEKPPEGRQC